MNKDRWPYRVIVRHKGEVVGSPDGIPFRDKVAAQSTVDSYNKRGKGETTAKLIEVKR